MAAPQQMQQAQEAPCTLQMNQFAKCRPVPSQLRAAFRSIIRAGACRPTTTTSKRARFTLI